MTLKSMYQKARSAVVARCQPNTADSKRRQRLMLFAFISAFVLMPEVAMAAPWDSTATQVLAIFTGGLTRTIAIIAVIACGLAALAGKLAWDTVIKVVIGIVLIFGATAIVDYFVAASGG